MSIICVVILLDERAERESARGGYFGRYMDLHSQKRGFSVNIKLYLSVEVNNPYVKAFLVFCYYRSSLCGEV